MYNQSCNYLKCVKQCQEENVTNKKNAETLTFTSNKLWEKMQKQKKNREKTKFKIIFFTKVQNISVDIIKAFVL